MFKLGQTGSVLCAGSLLAFGLTGCTAILDFSAPISEVDASTSDAVDAGDLPSVDASALDAALPAICSSFEPNNSTTDMQEITAGVQIQSAVCSASDSDIYFFMANGNQDVSIGLVFAGDGTRDLDLRLLDAAAGVIITSEGDNENTHQVLRTNAMATALTAGTYYIEVQPITVSEPINYTLDLSIVAF